MKKPLSLILLTLLAGYTLSLSTGCSCGFDCSGSNGGGSGSSSLTLGFSDALPEELDSVTLKVTRITFRRGDNTEVVDTFNLGNGDVEDFQVDLLDYPGVAQLVVIRDLELDTGTWDITIDVAADGEGIEDSFVDPIAGDRAPLRVPNQRFVLQGMQLSRGSQAYTVEFGLPLALQFSESGGYVLSQNGVRLANNETTTSLIGEVDRILFNTVEPCDAKEDPLAGNRIYLYEGQDLDPEQLGDVFSDTPEEETVVAPYAVTSPTFDAGTDTYQYAFGFLPAGRYTLALSCDTFADDSVEYDGLVIPLPNEQIYQIELSADARGICNLGEAADCQPL